jgi:hypothetical protein
MAIARDISPLNPVWPMRPGDQHQGRRRQPDTRPPAAEQVPPPDAPEVESEETSSRIDEYA